MLTLRGQNFGSVFNAPGARGFLNEPYTHHGLWKMLGMDWSNTTFATKTVSLYENKGNMPTKKDGITPREFMPRCIYFNLTMALSGHVLNNVGISCPGFEHLLNMNVWQKLQQPFILSVVPIGQTKDDRLKNIFEFAKALKKALPTFEAPVALHVNFGCPNLGFDLPDNFQEEINQVLFALSILDVPLLANFGPTVDKSFLIETAKSPFCDGLWFANTVPYRDLCITATMLGLPRISPLEKRGFDGPGGLSGPRCLPWVFGQLTQIRGVVSKPIVVGNGIQTADDVELFHRNGADAIALGTIGLMRPWRMRAVIAKANELFGN